MVCVVWSWLRRRSWRRYRFRETSGGRVWSLVIVFLGEVMCWLMRVIYVFDDMESDGVVGEDEF